MRNELIQSLGSPYRAHMKERFFNLQSCAGNAWGGMYIWALAVPFRAFEAKCECTLVQDEIWIKMKDDRLAVAVWPTNQIKNWWCCRDESPVDRPTRLFQCFGKTYTTTPPPNTKLTLRLVLFCKLAQTTRWLWCNLQVHRHHRQAQIITTAFPKPSVGAAGTTTTSNMKSESWERFAKCF